MPAPVVGAGIIGASTLGATALSKGGQKAGKVPRPSAEERSLQKALLPLLLSSLYEKPEDALRAPEGWTQEEWEAYLKKTGIPVDLVKSGSALGEFKKTISEIEEMISGMSEKEKEELAPLIEDYERYRKMLEEMPELKQMQEIQKSGVPLSFGGRYMGTAFPARRAEATLRTAETKLRRGDLLRLLLGEQVGAITHPYNRLLQEAAERERLAGAKVGLFEYPYGLYKTMYSARYGVSPVQTTGVLPGLFAGLGTAGGQILGQILTKKPPT